MMRRTVFVSQSLVNWLSTAICKLRIGLVPEILVHKFCRIGLRYIEIGSDYVESTQNFTRRCPTRRVELTCLSSGWICPEDKFAILKRLPAKNHPVFIHLRVPLCDL